MQGNGVATIPAVDPVALAVGWIRRSWSYSKENSEKYVFTFPKIALEGLCALDGPHGYGFIPLIMRSRHA